MKGEEPSNICNRGTSTMGVQLEISRGLRLKLFPSLSRSGRKKRTERFHMFVDAVKDALDED
jgi:phage replication-related protein YjqB (UPF0714/DUF867 family)